MLKLWRDRRWKQWLRQQDIDFRSGVSRLNRDRRLLIEAPANIGHAEFKLHGQTLEIGAFATLRETFFHRVAHIGRFSSTGQHCRIGLGARAHPMNWLSTSGFQYEPGFFDRFQAPRLRYEDDNDEPVWIGNDAFIGEGAVIMSGVKVHDGAVVAAMAVVTHDVPPYAIVAGAPAKVVRYRFPQAIRERLLASRWWELAPEQIAGLPMNRIEQALESIEALRRNGQARMARYPRLEVRRDGCRRLEPSIATRTGGVPLALGGHG